MKNTTSWVLLVAGLAGCTTLRGRANSAYDNGKYLEAAALYDQVLKDHPGDKDALARRTRARDAELRKELVAVQSARVAGADATKPLATLLARRDGWGDRLAPDLANAIGFEVSDVAARIGGHVAGATANHGPLVGEVVVSHYGELLAHGDFATTRKALRVQLVDAGRARCEKLSAIASTPYWTWLTARYCAHWDVAKRVPVLPEQRAALDVAGTIGGETADETSALHAALAYAFGRSAWYAPTARGTVQANVGGELAVTTSSRDVVLTASWTDSVPYTDYETTQESYQEPYDDTETYTEEVPSTEYRTETVPCGDTTCTNTVPETVYHTEVKTRTVTKYRTAYRDVTNPVTRYRDVPRTEDYNAVERSARYHTDMHVSAGELAVDAAVQVDTSESGYDHDVTIAPAGVAPQRANLTTPEELAAREAAHLADAFVGKLDQGYRDRFCSANTFTLEEAAKCAYAGVDALPAEAHARLREILGDEEAQLAVVHKRAR